jgi:hypothetical protein
MKERDDSSFSGDYSLKDIQIADNDVEQFRLILGSKDFVSIHLNALNPIYINIEMHSFLKINQLIQVYPEENIVFMYNKQVLYTPSNSLRISRSSINCSRNRNSSLSDSFKNENMKNIKEEIINTDIIKPSNNEKIIFSTPINIQSSIEKEIYNSNNNNNNDAFLNNVKNFQKFRNENDDKSKRKFILFKWIYHFYLIVGIIILLHYISFINSEYYNNSSLYKWICILLIISLLYVGYIGIKNKNSNEQNFILKKNNLFKINFFIFAITIISFVGLALVGNYFNFIKGQGIIGYLIGLIYIITLIVEALYIIYYDVIIDILSFEEIKNDNIGEINKNNLHIQLVDVN